MQYHVILSFPCILFFNFSSLLILDLFQSRTDLLACSNSPPTICLEGQLSNICPFPKMIFSSNCLDCNFPSIISYKKKIKYKTNQLLSYDMSINILEVHYFSRITLWLLGIFTATKYGIHTVNMYAHKKSNQNNIVFFSSLRYFQVCPTAVENFDVHVKWLSPPPSPLLSLSFEIIDPKEGPQKNWKIFGF